MFQCAPGWENGLIYWMEKELCHSSYIFSCLMLKERSIRFPCPLTWLNYEKWWYINGLRILCLYSCAWRVWIWSFTVYFQSTLHIIRPTHINNEQDNINFLLIYTVQERYDSLSECGDVWQHWRWCTTSSGNSDWAELQPDCHIHAPAKENCLARSTEIVSEIISIPFYIQIWNLETARSFQWQKKLSGADNFHKLKHAWRLWRQN
jgi:hypothetical protein